ncbi:hypothetical protein ACFE04_011125 [Oxalis oulophora]
MSAIYKAVISVGDKVVPQALLPLWQHPAGPKTVFFWAPLFKWGLVIAGISDLTRPADKLSISQSSALTATGLIWDQIFASHHPKNWNYVVYQQSLKNQTESIPSKEVAVISENKSVAESLKTAS